jgi:SPP1 gp7 family putative phage head morphogenesis protein
MAWKVTADPGRFSEAVDWFLARSVITKSEAFRLDDDARQRAFWIGGGLQLSAIQNVFDEIGKALETGEDFDAWRKRVRGVLRDDAHALTVFRNATQRAYSTGRWRQMHDPDVLVARPYFMHDSVLDSRTTETCRKLDGIVLPAEHEHWKTHWPPGHHRCRRGVRSLRKTEAERRGITNVPPALDDAPGFGLAPDAQAIWKPDRKKHDPKLIDELERKQGKPKAKKAKAAPATHDPKYWEEQLRGQYGEAAPTVAWGRAMYERGLDRSAKEIVGELERLKAAGVPGLQGAGFADLKKLGNRPLRGSTVAAHDFGRAHIALAEHSLTIQRGTFPVLTGPGSSLGTQGTREAAKFYEQLLDKGVARPDGWEATVERGARAYASPARKAIVLGDGRETPTAIHEIAHAIEFSDARAVARSRAFLKARAGKAPAKKLSELTGLPYEPHELAWEDKFFLAYIGKDYGERATEVTSVGYETFARAFGLEDVAKKDLDMFHFLLGQLAGR